MSYWDHFWNGLDRFFKGAFEWPQQVIMRALRVGQDPNVDFFDEEGFADWAMIPGIVGMFDKDPKYVGSREIFDRTAGKLGIKHNWATELATNLLTDPTFYMTGGLTGAAKGARAGEKALRTWTMTRKLGARGAEHLQVSDVRKVLGEALEKGEAVSRSERRSIQRAIEKLDGLGEQVTGNWGDFARQSSKRELRLALPIMNHFGVGIRVAPGYESWFKLLNDKVRNPIRTATATAFGGTVGQFSLARKAFDNSLGLWGDFKQGFAKRGELLEMHVPTALGPDEGQLLANGLSATNREFFRKVFSKGQEVAKAERFQELLNKGKNPVQAANKVFGKHSELALSLLDDVEKASGPEMLQKLSEWGADYRAAVEHWGLSKGSSVLTDAGKAMEAAKKKGKLALRAHNAGRKVGLQITKTFDSDVGIAALRESEAKFRSAAANYQRYVEEVGREVLVPRMVAWATENGMSTDEAEKVLASVGQMGAIRDEIVEMTRMIEADGGVGMEAVTALQNLSARYLRSGELLQQFAADGRSSPYLRHLAKQLHREFGASVSDKEIVSLFKGPASEIIEEATDYAKHLDPGDPASHYIAFTGPQGIRGQYLQFIPTGQLEAQAAKLERQVEAVEAGRKGRLRGTTADQARADLKAINEVLHRRSLGNPQSRYVRKPPAIKRTEIPQGVRDLKEAPTLKEKDLVLGDGVLVGDEVKVGTTMRAALRLRAMSDEFSRVARAIEKGADLDIGPDRYREAMDVVEEMSAAIEDLVFQGNAGTEMRAALDQVRTQTLADMAAIGGLRPGAPHAYLAITRTSEEYRIIRELFDQDALYDLVDTAQPQFSAVFRRQGDQYTLEDLNDVWQALNDSKIRDNPAAVRYRETIEAVGKTLGVDSFKAFEERPTLILMNRLAQGRRMVTVRDFILDALNTEGANLHGGRVAGYVVGGEDVPVASLRKFRPRKRTGEEAVTSVDDVDMSIPEVEGLVLDMGNGEMLRIGIEDLQMNRAMLPLGSPDLSRLVSDASTNLGLKRGELVADAFTLQAGHGRFGAQGLLDGESILRDGKRLANLEGSYVMIGDKQVLSGLMGAINGQFKHHGKLMRGFDHVNFATKRWATIYRPLFHAFNVGSTVAQAHSVGVSMHNTAGGFADALRFMNGSRKVVDRYDAFALVTSPSKSATGWRFMSQEFLRVLRRNPELQAVAGSADELKDAGLVFRAGSAHYTMDEIMEAMRPLFSTASREGLRGTTRVSQTIFDIRREAMAGGAVAKAKRTGAAALESSEIMSRLTVMFGALRQGDTPAQAAKRALLATVDYSNLTTREREYMKRIVGFYTFARRYVPVAWKRFAEDPSYAATLGKVMQQDGLLEEQNGQIVMRVGKNKTLPIQRMVPQMDALQMGRAVVETVAEAGSFFSDEMAAVNRQHTLAGKADHPFTLGPLPTAAAEGAMGLADPDRHGLDEATKELYRLLWPLRAIFDPGDPYEEPTMLERFTEQVSPLRGRHTERQRAALQSQLRFVQRQVADKLKETTDDEERRVLRAELKRLAAQYKLMDKQLK